MTGQTAESPGAQSAPPIAGTGDTSGSALFVSVIIPVYDNPQGLTRCLASLARQTLPKARFEVIVIDNSPTVPVSPVTAPGLDVIFHHEPRPGSYVARNRGLAAARGHVLAFTDSDCEADPRWLEEGLKAVTADGRTSVVGGRVHFTFSDPARPSSVELYDAAVHMRQDITVARHGFAATANLFVRRAVFDEVGHFSENLKSGGDREWGQRAAACGYATDYAEMAVILHPARRSLAELIAKARRVKGGLYQISQTDGVPQSRLRQLFSDFAPPLQRLCAFLTDRSLPSVSRRLGVAGVMLVLKYASAIEGVRLMLGGEVRR